MHSLSHLDIGRELLVLMRLPSAVALSPTDRSSRSEHQPTTYLFDAEQLPLIACALVRRHHRRRATQSTIYTHSVSVLIFDSSFTLQHRTYACSTLSQHNCAPKRALRSSANTNRVQPGEIRVAHSDAQNNTTPKKFVVHPQASGFSNPQHTPNTQRIAGRHATTLFRFELKLDPLTTSERMKLRPKNSLST
jgi:hypothetical protein